jgi:hypothetical protein
MRANLTLTHLGWVGTVGAFLALMSVPIRPAVAQFGGKSRAKDFKLEFYEASERKLSITNRTRSFIAGAEGLYLTNNLVQLTSTRLENYAPGGAVTNLVALAPECFLDTSNRLVSSTGRLELLGLQRRLTVKGDEGFLFSLSNSTLIVSNHVRTYIHPELLRPASP